MCHWGGFDDIFKMITNSDTNDGRFHDVEEYRKRLLSFGHRNDCG